MLPEIEMNTAQFLVVMARAKAQAQGASPNAFVTAEELLQEMCIRDRYAAGRLASLDADLFGFSTICNSYPITIQTAGHLKELRPSAVTLFGGPQASVVDLSTLRHFPFVDFILRGEADRSLPELATRLAGGLAPETVPGITYRRAGEARRNPDAPLPVELDELPLPAFHLYPMVSPTRTIPVSYTHLDVYKRQALVPSRLA